jgi:peptidoglycan/LPS O-acetylase OafA/YrhL
LANTDNPRAQRPAERFRALDGLRGVLSLAVALAHLRFYGNYWDSELLFGMYMTIDFFFVLSGLVIAHSSLHRLGSRRSVYTFMIRRFGRVYPLHFTVLCAFLAMELVKLFAGANTTSPPFAAPHFTVESLGASFLLLQSWNLFEDATWNIPAWSISTEFYVYILFALSAHVLGKRLVFVAPLYVAAASLGLYLSGVPFGEVTAQYGGLRCISGFFCGYLLYLINEPTKDRVRARISTTGFSILEVATVLACGWFMIAHGRDRWSLLAPFIYTYVTWLFAFDGGIISKALSIKPLQVLGQISFTTYIIHDFVWAQLERVVRMIERKFDFTLFVVHGTWENGAPAELISLGSPAFMDFLACVALACLTVLSYYISRGYEMPILKYFQDLARDKDRAYSVREQLTPQAASKSQAA